MTLTNLLILVNVIAYVWECTTGGGISYDHGDLFGPYVTQDDQWWRIISSAFLHANLMHIGFNMVALFQLGNAVESIFGRFRFLLIYILAMIGSGISVLAFNYNVPTLGASGAIFGLFGALIAVGLRIGDGRGRTLIMQVMPIVVINLVFTFAVPGISIAGHLGGLATGLVAGVWLFRKPVLQQPPAYAYAFEPSRESAVTIEHPAVTIDNASVTYEPPAGAHEHPSVTIEHAPISEPRPE